MLHGRIGIWRTRASHIDDARVVWLANAPQVWRQAPSDMTGIDVSPHSTLAGFAAFGRASLWQYVIDPNRAAGLAVDLFLHSWHAEIGAQLDAMYAPVASKHENVRRELNTVRSQHLSMKTGLALMTAHEKATGRAYDLTLVTRYDILYFTPLHFASLGVAPLWLPHWCHRYSLTAEAGMIVRSACGNWPGHGEGYLVHPATSVGVEPKLRRSRKLTRDADFDFAYLDWWLIGTPDVARTFGDIYDKYDEYAAALQRIAEFPQWSHFYWGYHINRRLRMRRTVRHLLYEGVDFRLARHWHYGTHCQAFLGSPPTVAIGSSGGGGGVGVGRSSTGSGSDGGHDPAAAAAAAEAVAAADAADAAASAVADALGPTAAATDTALAAAAEATAAAATAARAVPGTALTALAAAGVDLSVFYRRRPKGARAPSDGGGRAASNETRQAAQLGRQCPFDARVRLYCPWHSAVCGASVRAAVLDAEAAAHAALNATTKMPLWSLFGEESRDARGAEGPPS